MYRPTLAIIAQRKATGVLHGTVCAVTCLVVCGEASSRGNKDGQVLSPLTVALRRVRKQQDATGRRLWTCHVRRCPHVWYMQIECRNNLANRLLCLEFSILVPSRASHAIGYSLGYPSPLAARLSVEHIFDLHLAGSAPQLAAFQKSFHFWSRIQLRADAHRVQGTRAQGWGGETESR